MFKSFYKMRNHYDRKRIVKWLEYYPGLNSCKFIILEKIHGSNFGIQFKKDGTYRFQKRTSDLSMDSNFFNFQSILDNESIVEFIEKMRKYCKENNHNWIFFGELFGDGVQKEVKYCKDRQLRLFDSYDHDKQSWMTPEETFSFVGAELYVPVIGFVDGLMNALEVNTEFNSILNPVDDNICEGVVIRPYKKNYIYMHDHLVIKKKNKKFMEKTRVKKPKTEIKLSSEMSRLSNVACSYVTENRLSSVISHMGEPEGMEDFGKFISEFIKDIKEDVLEENEETRALNKSDFKLVMKLASNTAVNMLKKRIVGL